MAVARSVPAVKADAARTLFAVKCSEIAWAVIDSGIQGDHAAFKVADGKSRVKASFDFSNFRKIVSLDNLRILGEDAPDEEMKAERLKELLHDDLKEKLSEEEADRTSNRTCKGREIQTSHPLGIRQAIRRD